MKAYLKEFFEEFSPQEMDDAATFLNGLRPTVPHPQMPWVRHLGTSAAGDVAAEINEGLWERGVYPSKDWDEYDDPDEWIFPEKFED